MTQRILTKLKDSLKISFACIFRKRSEHGRRRAIAIPEGLLDYDQKQSIRAKFSKRLMINNGY